MPLYTFGDARQLLLQVDGAIRPTKAQADASWAFQQRVWLLKVTGLVDLSLVEGLAELKWMKHSSMLPMSRQ